MMVVAHSRALAVVRKLACPSHQAAVVVAAVVRKLACPSHQVVVVVATVVRKLACPSHQVVVEVATVVRKLACPSHQVAVAVAAPTHYRLVVPVGSILLVLPLAPVFASLACQQGGPAWICLHCAGTPAL